MEKKASYDHLVKQKYREHWKEFLDHHLPSSRKVRKRLRVACFPGHEGLEVTEVYDKLGIERGNITGLEINPESADELEALNLGIRVQRQRAEDYFYETDGTYHVINLDFQGPLGRREQATLQMIFGRQRMHHWGVFGTNFLRKREYHGGKDYREALKLKYLSHIVDDFALGGGEFPKDLDEKLRQFDGLETRDIAEEVIFDSIRGQMAVGRRSVQVHRHLRAIARECEGEEPGLLAFLERFDTATSPLELHALQTDPMQIKMYQLYKLALIDSLRRVGWSELMAQRIYVTTSLRNFRGYLTPDHFSGKYVSENRSPMIFDFFKVERPDRLLADFPEFFYMSEDGILSVLAPVDDVLSGALAVLNGEPARTRAQAVAYNRISRVFNKITSLIERNNKDSPRVFIGSDAKGKKKKIALVEADSLDDVVLEDDTTEESAFPDEITDEVPLEEITEERTDGDVTDELPEEESDEITKKVIFDIGSKEDLYVALDIASTDGELPPTRRTAYMRETFTIGPELDSSLQQHIACWTMARRRGVKRIIQEEANREPLEETVVKEVKKSSVPKLDDELKAHIAAVATSYDVHKAAEIFGLSPGQVSAIKAHRTMGTYGKKLDAVVLNGEVFVAPQRSRRLKVILANLIAENGGLDNIPEETLEHFSIERVF